MGRGREVNASKGFKEAFARFFEEPTRETLREVLREHTGEHDELDFKENWQDPTKVAKHILGMANSGSGCIVVGVAQRNNQLDPVGLKAPKDKTEIWDSLADFLPDQLIQLVSLHDFYYEASEYPRIENKAFQVTLVEYDPAQAPFVAAKDGGSGEVRRNAVYVRRGASTTEANHEELQQIINRRLTTGHSTRREMYMREHFEQLKVLYEQLRRTYGGYGGPFGINRMMADFLSGFSEQKPNPNYPDEDFETFVVRAIARKKRRIEAELDIEDVIPPQ